MKRLGKCRRCGKRRTLPKKLQPGVAITHYETDPYCSAACCMADHGVDHPLPGFYQRDYTNREGAAA